MLVKFSLCRANYSKVDVLGLFCTNSDLLYIISIDMILDVTYILRVYHMNNYSSLSQTWHYNMGDDSIMKHTWFNPSVGNERHPKRVLELLQDHDWEMLSVHCHVASRNFHQQVLHFQKDYHNRLSKVNFSSIFLLC